MRFLATSLIVACLATGCAKTMPTPVPPTPVQIEPQPTPIPVTPDPPAKEKRTDLPLNWTEISGDGWSYGLPIGFDKMPLTNGMLANHYAINTKLNVGIAVHDNEENSLELFAQAFAMMLEMNGNPVLAVRKHNTKELIAVHSLNPTSNAMNSTLNFFVQKDRKVYDLSCSSEARNLKAHSEICFAIADTLKTQ